MTGKEAPPPVKGTIEAVLPRLMYRVVLEDGRVVRAATDPALRHSVVRLIPGSQVQLALSPHDPGRARITSLLRSR